MAAFEEQWTSPCALPVYYACDVAAVVDEYVRSAEVGVP